MIKEDAIRLLEDTKGIRKKEENWEHICKEKIGLEIKKTELEILEEKK